MLIGNLGNDPEVRHLEGNVSVARISVATNESYKDKNGDWQTLTEWHTVIAWRGLAERVEKQLKKGMLVYVEGKLTHRKYQDKDNNDKYVTEIVANTLRILEKRDGKQGEENTYSESPAYSGSNGPGPGSDDDLPF